MFFLQFLTLNLPENVSRPKSTFFIKICRFPSKSVIFIKIRSFHQNLQFSSKSAVFIKIHSFRQNPRFSSKSAFLFELSRGQHQIGILCETKDHWPRKVSPIFCTVIVNVTILLELLSFCIVVFLFPK